MKATIARSSTRVACASRAGAGLISLALLAALPREAAAGGPVARPYAGALAHAMASATSSQDVDDDAVPQARQIQVGALTLDRCHAHVWCGTLDRPFDPTGALPGTIAVHFEFYSHKDVTRASTGTFVAVEGGPGYPSTGTRGSYLGLLRPLLDTKDLVLMDNRGTGQSQVVVCDPLQTEHRSTGPSVADIARCGRSLGATAPLYSTAYAADDLAALLAALGRTGIDLYGDSYGTYFGQVFAYRHPTLLRSLVLDSAYPVPMTGGESPWYPFFAPTMRDEFDKVCARSPYCAALPGTSIDHIQPALDLLRAHPFDAVARNADGAYVHFRADASMLGLVMLAGAPAHAVASELDPAARAFAAGDAAPLLRLMAETWQSQDPRYDHDSPLAYSEGLFWAVSCQDYAQIYDMTLPAAARALQRDVRVAARERRQPGTYAPFTVEEFRGVSLDYSLLDACVRWPAPPSQHPPGPLVPAHPQMPSMPVLVLNGEIDTITTPPEGAAVASLFPNARHVVIANEFHVTALPPMVDTCGTDIVRRFFATLDPGDISCAAAVAPLRSPPVFPARSSALPLPAAQPGNEASPAQLRAAAAAVLALGDATRRLESAHGSASPALRGGGFRERLGDNIFHLQFEEARFTEDVAVTGDLDWPYGAGTASAQIVFTTADGGRGVLHVAWPEQQAGSVATLEGEIGGKRLRAQMPAP